MACSIHGWSDWCGNPDSILARDNERMDYWFLFGRCLLFGHRLGLREVKEKAQSLSLGLRMEVQQVTEQEMNAKRLRQAQFEAFRGDK